MKQNDGGGIDRLVTGSISRTLAVFALPTLLTSVLQAANGTINTIWAGRLLGPQALAASANAGLIMFLASSIAVGFGIAAAILVGQAAGRRDLEAMRRETGAATGFFLALSLAIGLAGWLATPAMLAAMRVPADALPLARVYLRITFIGLPPAMMGQMLMMIVRATGDAMVPLACMALACLLDASLNPLLIAGAFGWHGLGIAGGALASLAANLASLAAIIVTIYRQRMPIRLSAGEWRFLIPPGRLAWRLLRLGVPMGLDMQVTALAAIGMLGLINRFGVTSVAAYGAATQLWTYLYLPSIALGAAVTAMAAQSIGAQRWDRVAVIRRGGIALGLTLAAACLAVLYFAATPLLRLFLPHNDAAIELAHHMTAVMMISFPLFGITAVQNGIVRANGAVRGPLLIQIFAAVGVQLGVAHAFLPIWGEEALWRAFPAASCASVLLSTLYYQFAPWRSRPARG